MPLGKERRSHIKASPEEARKRLEVIRRERERIQRGIEEKQKIKRRETRDFLARRKRTPVIPEPTPPTGEIKYAILGNLLTKKSSDSVFIIGGGESVQGINIAQLANEDTIAINRSFFSVPRPTFFLSMDNTFYGKLNQTERNILTGDKNTHKVFLANFASGDLEEKRGVIKDNKNNMIYTLSFYDSVIKAESKERKLGNSIGDFYTGNNSGLGAIQFAIALGYKNIYLLGIDLISSSKTHFHGGYGERIEPFNQKLKLYEKNFIEVLQEYNKRENISKIISCSSRSRLNGTLEYKSFDSLWLKKEKGTLEDLVVVGYYTLNTPYEKEAQKTISSCNFLGLNHDFLGIPNLGNWQANTRYKARFMLDMLKKHPKKRLLYVDCDAIIRSYPSLFENYKCDIAVRYQDFRWRKNECLSGTIYMENNEKTKRLCEIWANNNDVEGEKATTFEQWNLDRAIQEMIKKEGLNFRNLPPEYTFIFDTHKNMYPGLKPVIEHFQASRKFRKQV